MGKQAKLRAAKKRQKCNSEGINIKDLVSKTLKNNWQGALAVFRPENLIYVQAAICQLDLEIKQKVSWGVSIIKKENNYLTLPDYPNFFEHDLDLNTVDEILVVQIKPIQKGYFCSYGTVTEANNKLEVWGTVPGALKSHLISVFPKHEDQKAMNIAYIFSQLCLRTCPNYWDENITDLSISHQLEKIYNNCTNGNKELPDDINLSTWGSYYDLAHTNPLTKSCSELILKGNP